MRRLLLLLLIGFAVSLTSCRNDFDFESRTGGLEFSKDTVYLDTVFTDIGSSTYTLKVYNRSDKNISIPSLRLKEGTASKYRLMVDGMAGQVFENVEILAKDSMYIFVSVTAEVADANPTDFLYTDKINQIQNFNNNIPSCANIFSKRTISSIWWCNFEALISPDTRSIIISVYQEPNKIPIFPLGGNDRQ